MTHTTFDSTAAQAPSADADYDYAIVGRGIGGLALAALLAHAGERVIIFEQHDVPGGYGHTFRSGRFSFVPNCTTSGIVGRANEFTDCLRNLALRRKSPSTG